LFAVVDTLLATLEILADMVATLRVKTESLASAVRRGYILATDLADYLVRKGEAFRTAHEVVARLVSYAEENGKTFDQLSRSEYQNFSSLFGDDVYSITIESSLAARDITGGTAPLQVKQALAAARRLLEVK